MAPFKINDYVKRLEKDHCGQGLEIRGIYVVASCWDAGGKGRSEDYRVELVGYSGRWDAYRFALSEPHYVQACPHGMHWSECSVHKDGSQ